MVAFESVSVPRPVPVAAGSKETLPAFGVPASTSFMLAAFTCTPPTHRGNVAAVKDTEVSVPAYLKGLLAPYCQVVIVSVAQR